MGIKGVLDSLKSTIRSRKTPTVRKDLSLHSKKQVIDHTELKKRMNRLLPPDVRRGDL